MTESRLKLNAEKTEFIIIDTQRQGEHIKNAFPIPILNQHVMPAVSTWNLRLIVYDNFDVKEHISQSYYHICD